MKKLVSAFSFIAAYTSLYGQNIEDIIADHKKGMDSANTFLTIVGVLIVVIVLYFIFRKPNKKPAK